MWFLRRPSIETVAEFLEQQREMPLSYAAAGATREDDWPAGFAHDRNGIALGSGAEVFGRASAALRAWRMFPRPWTAIHPADAPQTEGMCVALLIRVCGIWWLNAARIVYVVNDDDAGSGGSVKQRTGFAYGTLPGHVESGEESFTVTWFADDSVRYELRAFSRPRHWLVRLMKPAARLLQRRFVRESLAAMQRLATELRTP